MQAKFNWLGVSLSALALVGVVVLVALGKAPAEYVLTVIAAVLPSPAIRTGVK